MKFTDTEPQPIKFAASNFTYKSPKGMEETCGDLPCYRSLATETTPPQATSCWRFPRDQRLKFLREGVMWLTVFMNGHPPVSLAVNDPFQKEGDAIDIPTRTRLVIVVCQLGGKNIWSRWSNWNYAQKCLTDSVSRGEAPVLSGINGGESWSAAADAYVIYTDRGVEPGMAGLSDMAGTPVEYRTLAKS